MSMNEYNIRRRIDELELRVDKLEKFVFNKTAFQKEGIEKIKILMKQYGIKNENLNLGDDKNEKVTKIDRSS